MGCGATGGVCGKPLRAVSLISHMDKFGLPFVHVSLLCSCCLAYVLLVFCAVTQLPRNVSPAARDALSAAATDANLSVSGFLDHPFAGICHCRPPLHLYPCLFAAAAVVVVLVVVVVVVVVNSSQVRGSDFWLCICKALIAVLWDRVH